MLLPVGTAFGPVTARAVEFRAILARTRKPRTLLAAAFLTRLVEIARAVAGRAGIASAAIIALLPGLLVAAVATTRAVTKIPARSSIAMVALAIPGVALAIPRAAGEFPVAVKFSLGPIAAGTISVTRRPRTIRPVAARTVSILAETFTARRVWALLAAAVPRRIGPLVTELLLREASGRARIVAIPRVALRSRRGALSSRL